MARNDGIDRTIARNQNLTASKITNAQRHNEREKESYTNPDIVPDRLSYNVHFKSPTRNGTMSVKRILTRTRILYQIVLIGMSITKSPQAATQICLSR